MICTDVMQDASEIIHYDETGIPIYIRKGCLSSYPDMRALCHWHEDIEWIYIIEGEMNYEINGKKVLLKKNDCIIVNSTQMHFGYANKKQDCLFICILFHPSLLHFNAHLYERYVKPFIECSALEYIHYDSASLEGKTISKHLLDIFSLKEQALPAYEFEVLEHFIAIWKIVHIQFHSQINQENETSDTDIVIQKRMVSHIYQHYGEPLTLEDIASSVHVSKSKCCIIFRKYLQQSPIDFLNAYRLEVACNLLKSTDYTITQIATACGFNHLSYFSKIFFRKYNCTPREFRINNTMP